MLPGAHLAVSFRVDTVILGSGLMWGNLTSPLLLPASLYPSNLPSQIGIVPPEEPARCKYPRTTANPSSRKETVEQMENLFTSRCKTTLRAWRGKNRTMTRNGESTGKRSGWSGQDHHKGGESWQSGCGMVRDEVWYDFFSCLVAKASASAHRPHET